MKLSEISTEKLANVLLEIVEPVANIACDENTTAALKMVVPSESNIFNVGVIINNVVPLLLKTHREDMFKIIAVLSEKTVEEVRMQKGMVTIADIKNCVDKELIDFFESLANSEAMK